VVCVDREWKNVCQVATNQFIRAAPPKFSSPELGTFFLLYNVLLLQYRAMAHPNAIAPRAHMRVVVFELRALISQKTLFTLSRVNKKTPEQPTTAYNSFSLVPACVFTPTGLDKLMHKQHLSFNTHLTQIHMKQNLTQLSQAHRDVKLINKFH
jgi:hypothetical protein